MSVPLDRLYNYIESIANEAYGDVVISRFWPHGSKNLDNLNFLHSVDWQTAMTLPSIVCNDQEPLNFDFYQNFVSDNGLTKMLLEHDCYEPDNLRTMTCFDQTVLIHSEKQSWNVDKYQNSGFIPVYYWSHAIIALDWFRYAQHVSQNKKATKTFLIYNRAWSGTREYRVKFTELIHNNGLTRDCNIKFNSVDPELGTHYSKYTFENSAWQVDQDLSEFFMSNLASSCSSADFDLDDYENTQIEVVLETLFDDTRWHLTEKILRPIACAQPFILTSTAGSLQYLQSYGFVTYDSVWSEEYDHIQNPRQRLQCIIKLMQHINSWDPQVKSKKLQQANEIAQYNKQHFFSENFFNIVRTELADNLKTALHQQVSTNTGQRWLNRRKKICQIPELKQIFTGKRPHPEKDNFASPLKETIFSGPEIIKILQHARKYSR